MSSDLLERTTGQVFLAHRSRLTLVYLLVCAENSLRLAQPLILGLAINDLLTSSYRGLLIFAGQYLGSMLIGAARQMLSTRAFTDLQRELTPAARAELGTSEEQLPTAFDRVAEAIANLELAIPATIYTAFSFFGSLLLLGWYDPMLVPLCLLLVLPASLLNAASGRQMDLLADRIDEEQERQYSLLATADRRRILRHFDALGSWQVQLSDAETLKLALLKLFSLGVLLTALVHFCSQLSTDTAGAIPAGDVYAVICYLLLFTATIGMLPSVRPAS